MSLNLGELLLAEDKINETEKPLLLVVIVKSATPINNHYGF